jgi:hypothetical protein
VHSTVIIWTTKIEESDTSTSKAAGMRLLLELTYLPTRLQIKLFYFTADFWSALYILSGECFKSTTSLYVISRPGDWVVTLNVLGTCLENSAQESDTLYWRQAVLVSGLFEVGNELCCMIVSCYWGARNIWITTEFVGLL